MEFIIGSTNQAKVKAAQEVLQFIFRRQLLMRLKWSPVFQISLLVMKKQG